MATIQLFPRDQIVGVFRGFQEGGMEFHADLVLPYQNRFQSIPMHGQFLLVQLESPEEAVLGRITSLSSEGKLSMGAGEEFNIRAVRENRQIPEDLREQYLKYKVNIRVLGVLRNGDGDRLTFVASHRRLPHVGSPVAFPSAEVLQEIAGHNVEGAAIGHFALGEYIYAAGSKELDAQPWMQLRAPEVRVNFPISSLVSRRTFIFARAGFGKSNLNKLLFSKLYEGTPTVVKRGDRRVPVGTIIFDPDGEYFWPDDKGRPGLCDVPKLQDKLVVFTSREHASAFYQSFVASGTKLDIRRLKPSDVIAIALSPERQDQQNVRKLRGLNEDRWSRLVDLIDAGGNDAPLDEIADLLQLDSKQQEVEALAARSNMTTVVKSLHDRSSQFMDMLLRALAEGKLCVVDVSQMRGGQALILSGLILRRIFDRNQEEFVKADSKTIPTIAVVEEAQAVLNETATSAEPYIAWVKEGRKYDLGAVLVTQQPGSIPTEILSQGDNWFIFHLLSAADLVSVRKANAHFSEDILSALLNEPIAGQGVFWTSVGKPYPISLRVFSFEKAYRPLDPGNTAAAAETYASKLKAEFVSLLPISPAEGQQAGMTAVEASGVLSGNGTHDGEPTDAMTSYIDAVIEKLRKNARLMTKFKNEGVAWGYVGHLIMDNLPPILDEHEREDMAFRSVARVLDALLGKKAWDTFKKDGKTTIKCTNA
jgi:DNA helicase HerA-like ATPase